MTARDEPIEFVLDLGQHETRRLSAILDAIGDWDPGRVLADETEAYRRLYSDLDEDQLAVYRMLVEAGVLDEAADPAADPCRRAWAGCPGCSDQESCVHCSSGATCEEHWRYLLAAEPHLVFLQCPRCLHRWWHRTDERAGQRPAAAEALPNWPGAA